MRWPDWPAAARRKIESVAKPLARHGFQMARERPLVPVAGLLAAWLLAHIFWVPAQVVPAMLATLGVASAVIWIAARRAYRTNSPLGPAGLPVIYTTFVLVAPALVGAAGGFGRVFLPRGLVTPRLLGVLILFIVGLSLPLLLTPLGPENRVSVRTERPRRSPFLRAVGVVILAVAVLLRLAFVVRHGVGSFGVVAGSLSPFESQLNVLASLTPLAAVFVLLGADDRPRFIEVGRPAAVLLGTWAVLSLLVGSRDELIAPALTLIWAWNYRRRPVPLVKLAVIGLSGFATLVAVGVARVGGNILVALQGFWATLLRPVGSATSTTALAVSVIPDPSPYVYGSTYWAALQGLVPGVARSAVEAQQQTATLRFPAVIGYEGTSGLGFSPVAEAYWNFGLPGTLGIALLFGAFLVVAHHRARAFPDSWIHVLYPLALTRIPLGLRTDFLQQVKGVLVVLLIFVTARWVDARIQQLALRGRPGSLLWRLSIGPLSMASERLETLGVDQDSAGDKSPPGTRRTGPRRSGDRNHDGRHRRE